jgi:hypothetical protein
MTDSDEPKIFNYGKKRFAPPPPILSKQMHTNKSLKEENLDEESIRLLYISLTKKKKKNAPPPPNHQNTPIQILPSSVELSCSNATDNVINKLEEYDVNLSTCSTGSSNFAVIQSGGDFLITKNRLESINLNKACTVHSSTPNVIYESLSQKNDTILMRDKYPNTDSSDLIRLNEIDLNFKSKFSRLKSKSLSNVDILDSGKIKVKRFGSIDISPERIDLNVTDHKACDKKLSK